jgi:hypothetical protein
LTDQIARQVSDLCSIEVVADRGGLAVEVSAGHPDTVLVLHPPSNVADVPILVPLASGRTELYDLDFAPERISVLRWDDDHRRRGLSIGFPQTLISPAVAGEGHRTPVAGARRADGLLELWLEASATGRVRAVVDCDAALGTIADMRWRSEAHHGRLLIALADLRGGRRLGHAILPLDPVDGLQEYELLVLVDPAQAMADRTLFSQSVASTCTPAGHELLSRLGDRAALDRAAEEVPSA